MRRFPYRTISILLKVLACLVGAYCVVLGFLIAILGRSIECNDPPLWARLLWAIVLLQGLAYFLPNSWLKRSRKIVWSYLLFTFLPVLATIGFMAWGVFVIGFEDLFLTEIQMGACLIVVLLLAPLSLILSIVDDREAKVDNAP